MQESKFKSARRTRGLRVVDVASLARVSIHTVEKLDRGHVPSPVVRHAISVVLEVPESELFGTIDPSQR